MLLFRLAIRNLWRNARRTVLTTTVIIVGIGILVLGEGFISGVEQNIVIAAEDGLVGHVTIRPPNYPDQMGQHPVDELLELSAEQRKFLDDNTKGWTGRLLFLPTLIAGEDWMAVRAIGYDPETDERVFRRGLWRVEGAHPAPGTDEIMVSPGMRDLLKLEIGGQYVLQVRTHAGAINALDVQVSGVLTTTNMAMDNTAIWVPKELAERLVATQKLSHYSMRLSHRDDIGALVPRLHEMFGDQVSMITWETETRDLLKLQGIRRRALNILVFVLMALAAFGMANTILMAAHERTREVGTLRAMGMERFGVVKMFLLEGGLMGFGGSVLGVLWGGALVAHWASSPIDLTNFQADDVAGSLSFSALIYTNFEWSMLVIAVVFGTMIAILSSVYPARVASGMAPADAVRAE